MAREHHYGRESIAATVFAVAYLALFIWMIMGFVRGRYNWLSRWGLLFFHVLLRVVSQGLGIAFGYVFLDNLNLLKAYLVFSAEGYFTLTLTAFLFLKNWQEGQWGDSWLASKHSPLAGRHVREFWETAAMVPIWNPKRYKTNLMGAVHSLLLLGNGAIVSGGSLLVQSTDGETESSIKLKHTLALVLRSVGSGLFFVAVIYFVACWLASLLQERKTGRTAFHPTLSILGIVAIWLLVRGGFGLLQSAIDSLGYTNEGNYTSEGYTTRFLIFEYILLTLPEFMGALLMNCIYFTSPENTKTGHESIRSASSESHPLAGTKYVTEEV